tara:strand:+ start:103 stop:639 length:537 start_codon:yes stop_codon:yes gene_type:complete
MAVGGGYGAYAPPAGYSLVKDSDKKKAWAVPWIGITIIVGSLFMPYVSIIGFEITGVELIELFLEGMQASEFADSGDSAGSDDEIIEAGPLLISMMMLALSPLFFSLMALLSLFCMLFAIHPKWIGFLHMVYFGVFMICSFASVVDLGILGSYSVHEDLAGMGFFVGGLAGILLYIEA